MEDYQEEQPSQREVEETHALGIGRNALGNKRFRIVGLSLSVAQEECANDSFCVDLE